MRRPARRTQWGQWSLTAQTPREASADLRRLRILAIDSGHAAVGRRPVARLCADVAGRGRRADRPNLQSGQELQHPRGTSPTFTPDGKFVIFTIVPPKADDEREANAAGAAPGGRAPAAAGGRRRRRGAAATTTQSRNSLGIMSLPDGKVTTVEQVSSFRLPEESSTWVAYHKGRAGAGGGRGGGRAGGRRWRRRTWRRRRAGGGGAAAAEPAAQHPQRRTDAAQHTPAEKRKDAGIDLILRNLATGQDVDDPGSHRIRVGQDGHAGSPTRCRRPTRRRTARSSRKTGDGDRCARCTRARATTRASSFDEDGAAARVPERPGRVRQAGLAVPPLLLEGRRRRRATELVSAATRGMPQGMVVADSRAALLRRRRAAVARDGAAAAPPPADPNAAGRRRFASTSGAPRTRMIQPMQQVRADAGSQPQLPRGRAPVRQAVRAARRRRTCRTSMPGRIRRARSARRTSAVPAGNLLGLDLQRRVPRRSEDRPAPQDPRARERRRVDVARRQLPDLLRSSQPGDWYYVPTSRAAPRSTSPSGCR